MSTNESQRLPCKGLLLRCLKQKAELTLCCRRLPTAYAPLTLRLSAAPEPRRYPAYAKQSEAAPECYEFYRTLTRKCRPSPCPSTASSVDSGVGWLISMET